MLTHIIFSDVSMLLCLQLKVPPCDKNNFAGEYSIIPDSKFLICGGYSDYSRVVVTTTYACVKCLFSQTNKVCV